MYAIRSYYARSRTPVSLSVEIGSLFPLEKTISGRVILANMDETKRNQLLESLGGFSDWTEAEKDELYTELRHIKGKVSNTRKSMLTEGVTDFVITSYSIHYTKLYDCIRLVSVCIFRFIITCFTILLVVDLCISRPESIWTMMLRMWPCIITRFGTANGRQFSKIWIVQITIFSTIHSLIALQLWLLGIRKVLHLQM